MYNFFVPRCTCNYTDKTYSFLSFLISLFIHYNRVLLTNLKTSQHEKKPLRDRFRQYTTELPYRDELTKKLWDHISMPL